jgi:hypothetical protein
MDVMISVILVMIFVILVMILVLNLAGGICPTSHSGVLVSTNLVCFR